MLTHVLDIARSSASSIISWRWACELQRGCIRSLLNRVFTQVYMNLPVCTVAFILLALSLRDVTISRTKGASWQSFTQKIDFLGLYVLSLNILHFYELTAHLQAALYGWDRAANCRL